VSTERAALSLVGDVYGLLEIDEFRAGLLVALREALPSDWASLNELGPDPADTFSIVEPPLEARWHETWATYGLENPLVQRMTHTRDGRPLRFSDVASTAELHALGLYRNFYGPIGLEHQIAFTLPSHSDLLLGIALSRRDHNYSDAERELLELARPHLIQAYNNAMRHSQLLVTALNSAKHPTAPPIEQLLTRGLTAREAEVMRLASIGRSDREIGQALGISHRTVQKHLQRSYAKLHVRGRSEASSLVARGAQ
jgi:DNA-binding CsgD family transcriptional regulator